ncbi:hypothetical protein [Bosea sp. (in: a-proteobacteria)]|uniref:hypothetical protein n=1 Tax=Bosea sp. (in: a-proteobacteria) TaxID=1871050 RepID=UPI004033F3E5
MGVPFTVLPLALPQLQLPDLLAEVALQQDTIYLEGGGKAVQEPRLTGWQSDLGASFRYSGKVMGAGAGGMTPGVARVRDAVQRLAGVRFDSVLVNYYPDGRCGMRFHADPTYGCWAQETAVSRRGGGRGGGCKEREGGKGGEVRGRGKERERVKGCVKGGGVRAGGVGVGRGKGRGARSR